MVVQHDVLNVHGIHQGASVDEKGALDDDYDGPRHFQDCKMDP